MSKVSDIHYSRRHFLKRKQLKQVNNALTDYYRYDFHLMDLGVERASSKEGDILILDKVPTFFSLEGCFYLTLRGHNRYPIITKYVTVDMGAIPYLVNGADVMAPGIIDADISIKEGDIIWVRDEKNLKPILVGKSRESGERLVSLSKGKVVATLHFVGDALWNAEL
ncbi:MAG: RNA-binding protein [Candidatus Thermoplasmatota archaeon]|nr:RNA-binding protein [Candidatus Thermoplasmatota archaeon]MDP7263970.1 RNA-binding protein [Candidatus Thermoplasmatota archaeon]